MKEHAFCNRMSCLISSVIFFFADIPINEIITIFSQISLFSNYLIADANWMNCGKTKYLSQICIIVHHKLIYFSFAVCLACILTAFLLLQKSNLSLKSKNKAVWIFKVIAASEINFLYVIGLKMHMKYILHLYDCTYEGIPQHCFVVYTVKKYRAR